LSHRYRYFVWRDQIDDDWRSGDEAELEIVAMIDAIAAPKRTHIGQKIVVSLLTTEKPAVGAVPSIPFSGSINLRGPKKTAQAYVPSTPFWMLPQLIDRAQTWVSIGWTAMEGGTATITSVFVGVEDRRRFLELSVNAVVTGNSDHGALGDDAAVRVL
jgi:hypothetical protein